MKLCPGTVVLTPVNALHFVNDVLDLAPSCELHPQPLRNGLIQLLSVKPQLNTTKFNGCVWANLRAERVGVAAVVL